MEALAELAAELAERLELTGGLDPLGHDTELEVGREVQDHPDERAIGPAFLEVVHERHADLQPVDRERAQMAERRVAGPEVVEGQLHTERTQLVQGRDAAVGVAEHHAFGYLEYEPVGLEPALVQRRRDSADEMPLAELDR